MAVTVSGFLGLRWCPCPFLIMSYGPKVCIFSQLHLKTHYHFIVT